MLFFGLIISILFATLRVESGNTAKRKDIIITHEQKAQTAYNKGFAKGVMREGRNGVKLWNRTLIENDSPGVGGMSNKGIFTEPVFGKTMIKKNLEIEDPGCDEACIILYVFDDPQRKHPLTLSVNGHKISLLEQIMWGCSRFPIEPSWLKKGENEIILSCPEAEDAESGWTVLIARADEYKAGGWDLEKGEISYKPFDNEGIAAMIGHKNIKRYPKNIGDYSLISINGGKKWSRKGKGLHPSSQKATPHESRGSINKFKFEKGGVVGEYSVRINIRQYCSEGILVSPVIDLWSEADKNDILITFTFVDSLHMIFKGTTPPGTDIIWQIRAGVTMDPLKTGDWTDWVTLATGAEATADPESRINLPPTDWDPERSLTVPHVRYIQWRAVLKTTNPLISPSVESVLMNRKITRIMELPANIIVRNFHNADILYSSTGFTYQSANEPRNKEVIDRDDLDKVIEGAGGEFDAMVRLMDYASRRWIWTGPIHEYPKWNTIDIAERAHSIGGGGMCIQFAVYLIHSLVAMGHHARHVNIFPHEVVEAWSNEFDKWVYLDPTQGVDMYLYDKRTGIPLSLKDMHEAFYEMYGVTKPLDWTIPPSKQYTKKLDYSRLPIDFSTTDSRSALSHVKGPLYYILVGFLRMMPRDNFSTTSYPEPLSIGNQSRWPWDGYVNWYDNLAPPMLQYSTHTDRKCDFWPTLNRTHFEAVPEIYGDRVFIRMITFTPGFEAFQVRVNGGNWEDSDENYVWNLHNGKNRLEMRAKSGFGVYGYPSYIECNFVPKPIPKQVSIGSID